MACGPSSLRSVLICTCRLFSSTTRPGHDDVEQLVLRHEALAPLDQRVEHVERPLADPHRVAVRDQLTLVRLQLEAAKSVGGCHGAGRR